MLNLRSEAAQRAGLVELARELGATVAPLGFEAPVAHVYNPLSYAWPVHEAYLRRYGRGPKRVVFLGMNPGPFGMAQTGVPFGEIAVVRDWLRLSGPIGRPAREHPKRPVLGFACHRSEVSGRRLWGLFAERFGRPETFFAHHFVVNYCPLVFFGETGRNLTPDKLRAAEAAVLFAACDRHLRLVVAALRPEWVIGIGEFAEKRARRVLDRAGVKIGRILHPSPASPAANRDWPGKAAVELEQQGVWDSKSRRSDGRRRQVR
ncbi:MAG: single-stranded DNA-binding protein [Verrucomicrobia bacterium]|nr:single-stranded DNA-binding protein [Verrucomicrobiota bacterium]